MYVSQKVLDAIDDAFEAFDASVSCGQVTYSESYDVLIEFARKAKIENAKRKLKLEQKKKFK